MGGNALKNTVTERKSAQDYIHILFAVMERLQKLFPGTRIAPILSYAEKETFGDLDLLVCSDNLPANWTAMVKAEFAPNEFISNGGVHSFDYDKFQIDLVMSPEHEMDFAAVYFSFNDLGNLMGRIANIYGFKYAHNGLWKVVRDDKGEPIGKALVTGNPAEAFYFLGYDFKRYRQGFRDLEAIFEFVVSSRFFHSGAFQFENRNNKDSARDRKRPTYMAFLKWLNGRQVVDPYLWVDSKTEQGAREKQERQDEALAHACLMYPDFDIAVAKMVHEHTRHLKAKELFNGDIVRQLTGLQYKALGEFIAGLKATMTALARANGLETADEWVVTKTSDEIKGLIRHELHHATLSNVFPSMRKDMEASATLTVSKPDGVAGQNADKFTQLVAKKYGIKDMKVCTRPDGDKEIFTFNIDGVDGEELHALLNEVEWVQKQDVFLETHTVKLNRKPQDPPAKYL